MTDVRPTLLPDKHRHDVVDYLRGNQNVGIELGVARGVFSKRMVDSKKFSHFFGVDMYADIHDTNEYKTALKDVGLFSNYKLLRMRFDEAFDLFPDQSIDFLYVDGYAHSGEEGGKTIFDWCRKVKIGGVIAGDDYHSDWPLVVEAVNEFVSQSGFQLMLTGRVEPDNPYCRYPTWIVVKTSEPRLRVREDLIRAGEKANRQVQRQRERTAALLSLTQSFRSLIPKKIRILVWKVVQKFV